MPDHKGRIAEILCARYAHPTEFYGDELACWADDTAVEVHAALHPRIDTVEQLDGTVVRTDEGAVYEKDARYTSAGEPWWPAGYDVECSSDRIGLPARVLYNPEVEQ